MAKAADKPKAKSESKVFDVAKPGKVAPSASSKPIIITNRPVLKDPMVVDGDKTAEAAPAVPPSKSTVQIKPIHITADGELETEPAAPEKAETPPEPVDDQPAAAEPAEPEPAAEGEPASPAAATKEDETEPSAETTPESSEKPAPPAPEPSPKPEEEKPAAVTGGESQPKTDDDTTEPTDPKADEEAARKQAERDAEVEKLVESRKYYLPINQVEKRRNKRAALLGLLLIIILVLAWADIALDAGIIKIAGVKPVTHFFNK